MSKRRRIRTLKVYQRVEIGRIIIVRSAHPSPLDGTQRKAHNDSNANYKGACESSGLLRSKEHAFWLHVFKCHKTAIVVCNFNTFKILIN